MYLRMAGLFALASSLLLAAPTPGRTEEGSMSALIGHPSADLSPKGVFERIDESGDGKVNRAELRNRKMSVFFLRDQDQDTHLSRQEFDVLSDPVFAALDEDKDGRISGFEFNQGKLIKFESIDADGDDAISFAEFEAFRIRIRE